MNAGLHERIRLVLDIGVVYNNIDQHVRALSASGLRPGSAGILPAYRHKIKGLPIVGVGGLAKSGQEVRAPGTPWRILCFDNKHHQSG